MDPLVGSACAPRGPVAYGAGTRGSAERTYFPFGLRDKSTARNKVRYVTAQGTLFDCDDWQLYKDAQGSGVMLALARLDVPAHCVVRHVRATLRSILRW